MTTLASPQSAQRLESALSDLLAATTPEGIPPPVCLYKLQYEQSLSAREPSSTTREETRTFAFPSPSLNLFFDDGCLGPVKDAWKLVMGDTASGDEYMVFEDREGVGDDEEVYD